MQCLCLIFQVILCSLQIPGPTICISHFPPFSFFSHHILGPTVIISLFPLFFTVSWYISAHTVFVYHFPHFSGYFFSIFQVLQCTFHSFPRFSLFLPYSSSYSVHFTFSIFFRILGIFYVLVFAFFVFHVFQCFSPYFMSYNVCVSFSTFLSSLPLSGSYSVCFSFSTFLCFVSHFPHFYVSRHIPGTTM